MIFSSYDCIYTAMHVRFTYKSVNDMMEHREWFFVSVTTWPLVKNATPKPLGENETDNPATRGGVKVL